MAMQFIDLKSQYAAIKDDIHKKIDSVLEHGQYIMGPEVYELENELSEFLDIKHSISCSNGTDALVMALMAADIKKGDEIIVPAFSFIATAEAVVLCGATPVMIDIDPKTYNLDPSNITEAITAKTKAIIPVSLYGQPADFNAISKIAKQHNLLVIEDAAQSFGALHSGRRSGTLGDINCTSFFPAKPLGCYGDGGAIFTEDDKTAEALKCIRVHGSKERYFHTMIGTNGRLDSLQCAILQVKLKRYPWEISQRQKVANHYTDELKQLESYNLITPYIAPENSSVWAQYTIQVEQREKFQAKLTEKGVPTAIHYPITMGDQPAYKDLVVCHNIEVSRSLAKNVISLPMYPDMDEDTQAKIIEAIKSSV